MKDSEFRSWYAASDGLCLPHLRRALSYAADQQTADYLVHHAATELDTLVCALREHRHDGQRSERFRSRADHEEVIGMRLVAFLSGESATSDSPVVQQQRDRALTARHSRPAAPTGMHREQSARC